jgi:hypothetical protein
MSSEQYEMPPSGVTLRKVTYKLVDPDIRED